MVDYLKGIIYDFGEVETLTRTAASPAMDHLYAIREESDQKLLDDKRSMEFHHYVAKLLFACPRAQKDIQTAFYFQITRMQSPDKDDWGKIKARPKVCAEDYQLTANPKGRYSNSD